ncbi:hypothetical protein ABFS83_14G115300 [Erythranthe nasuta]
MGNTLQTLPQIPPPPPPPPPPPRPDEQEEEELQERRPEAGNREFTCEICIEPASIPGKKFRNGGRCSHPFCTDCVVKYIRVQLEDNAGRIKCPALNCGHALDPRACASLVGDALFVRWCDVLCEAAIVGSDRCYCPYRNCSALILNECGGVVKKSTCPSCKRCFCFQCKGVWHAGFGCEESGEIRDTNDVAFGRLVERRKWNRCPRCRHFVELREGCKIVKCRCGISFCYKCGKLVNQHWCSCDKTSRCCEWTFKICIVLVVCFTFTMFFMAWQSKTTTR